MDSKAGPHVLAITSDEELAAGIRRACAAADRDLHEHTPPVPRRAWLGAAYVVLDSDAARACVGADLPRRAAVHLVSGRAPGLTEWQAAAAVGAESVLVLPGSEPDLVAALARRVETAGGRGPVIAVVGGRGGAGASTLAAALALASEKRFPDRRALLVDCDPTGGGLDLLLGVERSPGMRWPSLLVEGGAVSASALHAALPGIGGKVSVLSCGRGPGLREPGEAALTAVVDAGRGAGDVVICDVPRQSRTVTDVALGLADVVVVVVRAQVRAVAAAGALISGIAAANPNIVVVVRGPAPGGLRGAEVEELLGMPVLAGMRPEPGLAGALERGGLRLTRRSPLRRAADAVLDVVAGDAA
ncbi:septum site-determining protein Ssd [Rhodococcus gannanensis]|uniref:Septum site-determining protein Ssd n=1 Tax=Rhodococcus gannanensis TaxID=1960308 RepID=A0ABW4PBL5_9NOCA